jgi:Replication-relaxation
MSRSKSDRITLGMPVSTKRSRLPRYARVKNPPAMVLTERDQEILRQVYAYRLMTREQIERLLFQPENRQEHLTKTSKVRKRLKLLYQHGYLERIAAPIAAGAWAWRPVYRLGRKGAALVASERGIAPDELPYWGKGDDRDHRTSRPSFLFLDHTLAINDVRISIVQAASACGYRIEKWLDEAQLKSAEMKEHVEVKGEQGRSTRVPVIPDAYFVLHLGDRRTHLFLELDRATMTNGRWKTRVLAYLAYLSSGRHRERYGMHSLPRVLVVTTGEQRLLHLKKATAQAGGQDLFWFTTMDQVTAKSVLSSPIWRLASDERESARKTLVE